MMRALKLLVLVIFTFTFTYVLNAFADDETVELTTYYPAPYGQYEDLTINNSLTLSDGNEAEGNVLVSDANGVATWTDSSALSGAPILTYGCDNNIHNIDASSSNITDNNVSTSIVLKKDQYVKVVVGGTIAGDFYTDIVSVAGDVSKVTTVDNRMGCTMTSNWNPFYLVAIWRANSDTTATFKQRFYKSDRSGVGKVSGRTIIAEIVKIQA
jgi:hypothetical protein